MKLAVGPSPEVSLSTSVVRTLRRTAQSATAVVSLLAVGVFSGATAATSNEAEAPISGESSTPAAAVNGDVRLKLRRASALLRGIVQYSSRTLEAACGRGPVPPAADRLGRRLPAGMSVPLRC